MQQHQQQYELVCSAGNGRIAPPIYLQSKTSTDSGGSSSSGGTASTTSTTTTAAADINIETATPSQVLKRPQDYFVRNVTPQSRNPDHWASEIDFVCNHCFHPHRGLVIGVPLSYSTINGYERIGQFCSFSCALAYIIDKKDMHTKKLSALLQRMAIECYDYPHKIKPAPPREMLKICRHDGQGVSIEEFRANASQPIRLSLQRPPFFHASEFLLSEPTYGHPDYADIQHYEHTRSKSHATIASTIKFNAATMIPMVGDVLQQQQQQHQPPAAPTSPVMPTTMSSVGTNDYVAVVDSVVDSNRHVITAQVHDPTASLHHYFPPAFATNTKKRKQKATVTTNTEATSGAESNGDDFESQLLQECQQAAAASSEIKAVPTKKKRVRHRK